MSAAFDEDRWTSDIWGPSWSEFSESYWVLWGKSLLL